MCVTFRRTVLARVHEAHERQIEVESGSVLIAWLSGFAGALVGLYIIYGLIRFSTTFYAACFDRERLIGNEGPFSDELIGKFNRILHNLYICFFGI